MDSTSAFYSQPSYVGGGVIFSGARRQRGGSILGALKSIVVPVLKTVGRSFGRIATKGALGMASDVINDTLSGRNVKESLKSRGKQRLLNAANEGLSTLGNMIGNRSNVGKRRRKKQRGSGKSLSKHSRTRSRSRSRRRSPIRKRRNNRSLSQVAKRRRIANY